MVGMCHDQTRRVLPFFLELTLFYGAVDAEAKTTACR
jgi:hypothetical protein